MATQHTPRDHELPLQLTGPGTRYWDAVQMLWARGGYWYEKRISWSDDRGIMGDVTPWERVDANKGITINWSFLQA